MVCGKKHKWFSMARLEHKVKASEWWGETGEIGRNQIMKGPVYNTKGIGPSFVGNKEGVKWPFVISHSGSNVEIGRTNQRKNIYFCFIDYAKAFDCVDHDKLWKILKEMGIPDHLTCLVRNLYAGQEATVRTGHGTTDWFQTGIGVCQGFILSPCLFNLYAEYIVENAGLDDKLESRLPGEISITLDMHMTSL